MSSYVSPTAETKEKTMKTEKIQIKKKQNKNQNQTTAAASSDKTTNEVGSASPNVSLVGKKIPKWMQELVEDF